MNTPIAMNTKNVSTRCTPKPKILPQSSSGGYGECLLSLGEKEDDDIFAFVGFIKEILWSSEEIMLVSDRWDGVDFSEEDDVELFFEHNEVADDEPSLSNMFPNDPRLDNNVSRFIGEDEGGPEPIF
jgi:hypothetical protein